MSSYDFTTRINREGKGSSKWMLMHEQATKPLPEGIVPLSVADMEFFIAPEISRVLHNALDTTVLGYARPTDAYYDAVIAWQATQHEFSVKREWICTSPGVVPAFHAAIRVLTEPGDGVIIQQPVYYPFMNAITSNGRRIVNNALINDREALHYSIDFDDLEKKAADPQNKVLLLCSPHNPVGRVWTKEELRRMCDICFAHDVFIIADEIHNDIVMPGHEHTTLLILLDEDEKQHALVCTSPSKTFNLAGFQVSNIFIPNAEVRANFEQQFTQMGFGALNALGYLACRTAYEAGRPWFKELLACIEHNYQVISSLLANHLPELKVYPLEGTYLMWIDFGVWGLAQDELERFLHEEAFLFFDEGYIFGEEGSGFERVNLAAPTQILVEAFTRLIDAKKHLC